MSTGWASSSGFGGPLAFSGGTQQPSTAGFGSTTTNSFGQKPNAPATSGGLFGNSSTGALFGQNSQNQNLGGLFGSSGASSVPNSTTTQPTTGGLFGNSTTTTNNATSGLFGNTANKPATATGGGLFGNSSTTGNTGNTSTGLFGGGNTSTASAPSGGLFGYSNTANPSGGLFGNSNTAGTTANAPAGGLFGAKPATGGLFGGSSTPAASGGLFGNSTAAAPQTSTGDLFSKPAAPTGGLFGNATLNKPTTGLFGGSTNTGGLFGNSSTNTNQLAGGLFGQPANTTLPGAAAAAATSASNANPYLSGLILSTINRTEAVMPLSITGGLFAGKEPSKSKSSQPAKSQERKSSLLSKLAQTFNIFRTTVDQPSESGFSKLKGIFTQLNFVKNDQIINKSKSSVSKPRNTSNAFILLLAARGADVKKLVIKSKPLKFHLINADKVFNAKRKRVLTLALQATSQFHTLTDEEDEDGEEEAIPTENFERKFAEDVPLKTGPPELVEEVESETEQNKDGYWCSPPIKELRKLSPAELSYVDNFIVGRYNVGQIAYNYPVDLSGLFLRCDQEGFSVSDELFGKIVKMRERVVQVYDVDDAAKPPIGFELNVPATITIKTPPTKKMSKQNHIKRLQNMTGMEFVTFDPLTNNWTFKVKHFSVWGLIDDSDDEEEDSETKRLRELKKKQDLQESEASVIYSRIYENEAYNQQLKRQKIGGTLRGIPGGWDYDATNQSGGALIHKQKLVEDEINRLFNIYKEDKSVDALAANASDITLDSDSNEMRSPSIAGMEKLYADEVKNYDYLKQIVSVLPPNTDLNDLVDEKAYEPSVEDEGIFDNFNRQSALVTSKDWLLQLELANDIDSALVPYLTIPRNQKLSLKAVNDILFSDFDRSSVDSNQISTPIKEITLETKFISPAPKFDISSVSKLVQNLLLKSNIEVRPNKFPRLQLDTSLSFKQITSINKLDTDSEILSLASILFDKVDLSAFKKYEKVVASHAANSDLIQRLNLLEQKKELTNWLKRNSKSTATSYADSLAMIEHYVIRGEVKAAIQLALSSQNAHLAALLNLVDSNDDIVKTIVKNQVEDWQVNNVIDLIPPQLLNIYKIMAGQFDEAAKGLSFMSAVGLGVFYGNPSEPLESTLKRIEDSGSDDFADMLKVYTTLKLEGLSASINAINEASFNERVKWILFAVLTASYGQNIVLANGDEIVQNFGSLLAANAMSKEAIFVFASFSDDEKVKNLVRKTVIDEVQQLKGKENDEEEYVVKVLGVPRSLVYEAVAIEKSKQKDYWGQASALIEAELWKDAHECVCEHLGPAAVIDNNYDLKTMLRALISSFPEGGSTIPNWNQGAGTYAAYFNVLDLFVQQESATADVLSSLLNNLALMPDYDSFNVNVAISLMSKKVADIALENRDSLPDLKKKILALKVGENERQYLGARLVAVGL